MKTKWLPITVDKVQIVSEIFQSNGGSIKGDDADFDNIQKIRLRQYCDLGSETLCYIFQVCSDKLPTLIKVRAIMILQ